MKLQLNTESATIAVKNYFEIGDTTSSEVYFRRSGAIASVTIKGLTVKDKNPILSQIKHIVSDAMRVKNEIDIAETKLDEDTLVGISALRVAR